MIDQAPSGATVAAPTGVAATMTGGTSPVTSLVNLNTADQVALESLPEVGPVTAQSILAWRSEHGAFTSVDQLLDVDGIGEVTLAGKNVRVSVHGDFVGRTRVSQDGRAHLERHSGVPRCFAGTRVKVTRSGTVVAYGRFHRERHHDDDMGYGMGYRIG